MVNRTRTLARLLIRRMRPAPLDSASKGEILTGRAVNS
jgi:hypothetical protein